MSARTAAQLLQATSSIKAVSRDFVFSCLWTSLTRFLFTKNLVHMKQALGKSLLKVYQLNRFPVFSLLLCGRSFIGLFFLHREAEAKTPSQAG